MQAYFGTLELCIGGSVAALPYPAWPLYHQGPSSSIGCLAC